MLGNAARSVSSLGRGCIRLAAQGPELYSQTYRYDANAPVCFSNQHPPKLGKCKPPQSLYLVGQVTHFLGLFRPRGRQLPLGLNQQFAQLPRRRRRHRLSGRLLKSAPRWCGRRSAPLRIQRSPGQKCHAPPPPAAWTPNSWPK